MNGNHYIRSFPYQPFLIAAFVCSSIYATNRLYFTPEALILPFGVLVSFITLALVVLKHLKLDLNKGLIFISGALLLNFVYFPGYELLYIVLWSILITLIWSASRSQAKVFAEKVLGVMSISLFFIGLSNLGYSAVSDPERGSKVTDGFEKQFQSFASKDLTSPLNNRDFYFIILDRYSGEETLFARTKRDNSQFYETLNSLGFTVLENSKSNYGVTNRSIPSMLNLDYYDALKEDGYNEENNRLWRFFKGQGFKFVFLPSNWVTTTKNVNADIILNPYPIKLEIDSKNITFQKIMFFERTFSGWVYYKILEIGFDKGRPSQALADLHTRIQNPVGPSTAAFNKQFNSDRQFITLAQSHIPKTFESLAQIPKISGKKFVFSHINHWEHVKTPGVDPLTNVNQMLVGLVKVLIAESDPDPVIVIMSDHGHKPFPETVKEHAEIYAKYARYPEKPIDREEIIASWYTVDNIEMFFLPDGGDGALYSTMTPVNSWRVILNYYFGTSFDRLDDRSFWKWQGDSGITELH